MGAEYDIGAFEFTGTLPLSSLTAPINLHIVTTGS
jgi:hypothetical protein